MGLEEGSVDPEEEEGSRGPEEGLSAVVCGVLEVVAALAADLTPNLYLSELLWDIFLGLGAVESEQLFLGGPGAVLAFRIIVFAGHDLTT